MRYESKISEIFCWGRTLNPLVNRSFEIKSIGYLGLLVSTLSHASGFSLYTESNGEAVGNFAAGIAAEAADASIGWFNPAGLALLDKPQILVGGVGVLPYVQLSNGSGTYTTENSLDPTSPFIYSQSFSALYGAQDAFVPSVHIAYPLAHQLTAGLSVVAPFGLSTDWDVNSPVRYEATYTKLMTLDVSPEIGGAITHFFDVGLGLDFQYADVTFNRVVGSPAVMNLLDFPVTTLDSYSYNQGNSFSFGFHGGLLAHFFDNHTRVGVNYQSAVNHEFEGYSQLTGRLADPTLNAYDPLPANPDAVARSESLFSNQVSLPSITTVSLYQDVNEKVALLASVVYTTWSSFQNVKLYNVQAAAADPYTGEVRQIAVNAVTEEHYRDTWRMAVGANYKLLDKLMLRLGTGYEETPTDLAEKDIRLPDTDRWAASVGAHYQYNAQVGIDIGYTHLFFKDGKINKTDPIRTSEFHVSGSTKAYANLVGAQVVWTMD